MRETKSDKIYNALVKFPFGRCVFFVLLRVYCFFSMLLEKKLGLHINYSTFKCSPKIDYTKISKFKNVHKGERCFIVCTGPSLNSTDLNKISGEITISMNSIVKLEPELGFRPTYYVTSDPSAASILFKYIEKYWKYNPNYFVGTSSAMDLKNIDPDFNSYTPVYEFIDPWYQYLKRGKLKFKPYFSDDLVKGYQGGCTVTAFCLQLAVYMGFSEIYLLGNDGYQNGDLKKSIVDQRAHYKLLEYSKDELGKVSCFDDTCAKGLQWANQQFYHAARKYCDSHNIKIRNCTRGGYIEAYIREDLDEVLKRPKP